MIPYPAQVSQLRMESFPKLCLLMGTQNSRLRQGSALMLGLAHHHDGDDLVVTEGWEAMLDGLGFTIKGKAPMRIEDAEAVFKNRIAELRNAAIILEEEKKRKSELEQKRSTVRIAAETDARQRGLGIAETDKIGKEAANQLPDPGPKNPDAYLRAQILEDDHQVDGIQPTDSTNISPKVGTFCTC